MALTDDKLSAIRPSGGNPYGEAADNAAVSVVEKGHGEIYHITQITLDDLTVITPAGAADLADGELIYTFPGGRINIDKIYMNVSLATAGSTVTADTPDLGLGTTVASGAVAVLGGTAAFENILAGQTVNDVNGTAEVVTSSRDITFESTDDKTVYLNIADGWAGAEATGVQASGTIIIIWYAL